MEASSLYKISWHILAAITQVESGGNQWAYRYEPRFEYTHDLNLLQNHWKLTAISCEILEKSSFGYCQVMGGTAVDLGLLNLNETTTVPTLLYRPDINYKFCCKLLNQKIKEFGDDPSTLYAAYNAGTPRRIAKGQFANQGNVDRFNRALNDFNGKSDILRTNLNITI